MSVNRDDHELEQLLSDTEALRARYREASNDHPPARIDAAVRAAARRATGSRPVALASAFSGSWRVPLSIAAVIVVSVTLTLTMRDRGEHLPVPPSQMSKVAPKAQAGDGERGATPEPRPRVSAPATVVAPGSPPAIPARQAARVREASKSNADGMEVKGDERAPQSVLPPALPAANVAPAPEARVPESDRSDLGADSSEARRPQPQALAESRPPRDAEASSGASADASKETQGELATQKTEQSAARAEQPAANRSTSRAVPAAPARQAEGPVPESSAPWEGSPQAWVKHIEELRAKGLTAQARDSLAAFRRKYPDYVLPSGFVAP